MTKLDGFRDFLKDMPSGSIPDATEVERHLSACWDMLGSGLDGGMTAAKLLGRMENADWQPPYLSFEIERHGGTVHGSTRAELQRWIVDVDEGTATRMAPGVRQIRRCAPRLDTLAIARKTAARVKQGKKHESLKWLIPGQKVRIFVGQLVNARFQRTLEGRRKRFRGDLEA